MAASPEVKVAAIRQTAEERCPLCNQPLPLFDQPIVLRDLARQIIALFLQFDLFLDEVRQVNDPLTGIGHFGEPGLQMGHSGLNFGKCALLGGLLLTQLTAFLVILAQALEHFTGLLVALIIRLADLDRLLGCTGYV